MIEILLLSTVFFSIIGNRKNLSNGTIVAFSVLFFLFAFQYKMTIDWDVYVERWKSVNASQSISFSRELEVCYQLILTLFRPFGYYFFLFFCAAFNIYIYYKYVQRIVKPKFVWIFMSTFSLNLNFALSYINCQRQTLSISFVLIGLYVLLFINFREHNIKKYLYAFLFFLIAFNTHQSAIIAFPMIFFPYVCEHSKNTKWLYVFVLVYVASFFIDFAVVANVFMDQVSQNLDGFSQYTEEIRARDLSIVEQFYFCSHMLLMIYYFDKFNKYEKVIVLNAIVYFSIQGYAMYTMARSLYYYQIFSAYAIAVLYYKICKLNLIKPYIRYSYIAIYVIYCYYGMHKYITGPNFYRWTEGIRTIFDY